MATSPALQWQQPSPKWPLPPPASAQIPHPAMAAGKVSSTFISATSPCKCCREGPAAAISSDTSPCNCCREVQLHLRRSCIPLVNSTARDSWLQPQSFQQRICRYGSVLGPVCSACKKTEAHTFGHGPHIFSNSVN